MPRQSLYTPEEVHEALKDKNFMDDGKYLERNHHIWTEARDLLPKMTVDYLWIYITKNRNDVSSRIHNVPKLKVKNKKKVCNISNWSMNDNKHGLEELKGTIHFTLKQWNQFGLNLKLYKDGREYEVFEPGWTDLIYQSLWENFKIPCPFKFQSAKIKRNTEEHFLMIKGTCIECQNNINIYSVNEPNGDGIDIIVSTFDAKNVQHYKKRQLRGRTREKVANILKGQSTYMYRRNVANQRMHFQDQEPADLFNDYVLRKAKQQQIDKELCLEPNTNEVVAVMSLKKILNTVEVFERLEPIDYT
ncbi:unnamed protein product [Parnassius apollo]|uniref:(apollo) hypothetical protein n=1 Tax=Parnassius apollo TaxID=110799 RepID=A0A8S3W5I6_PARAO|nr:unnamed protein product [Parnassius apollo]